AGRRLRGPEQDTEDYSAEEDTSTSPHKSGGNKKIRRLGLGSLFDKRSPAKMSEDIQSDEAEVIVKTVKETGAEGLVVTGGGKEGIFIKEDNEKGSPQMRSPRKKKQQDRISWPKFPSFGHRAQFKRSHSTSEAEEHKKLEMSPPTSDTESPLKAPLKSPDGKDKKKKQKIKMKMKMKGQRSKSVEEPQGNEKELASENLIVLDVGDTLEEKFPEESVTKLAEIAQDNAEAEYKDLSKIVTEHEVPSLTGKELQHKAHLINLGSTLKTTDISDAFAEVSGGDMTISVDGKIERSEIKFSIPQKDTSKLEVDGQSKTLVGISGISDTAAFDTIAVSHGALSHVEGETSQLDTDINTEVISKDSSEKNVAFGKMDMSVPKLDVSVDSSGVGVPKQSPRDVSEKQWKEKTIFENEIYGIKTRGPLADIAISRSHFTNGLQYIPPDSSEMIKESIMPETITVISQPELNDLSVVSAVDVKDSHLKIKTSKPPTYTNIHEILEKKSESKFKLPKVDGSGILIQEPIKRTKAEQIKTHLPKREDIEIPGMEDNESKPSLQTPGIKVPKIEKIINISKEREIQARRTDEEFNVEDVKEAVSKFPSFKLPEGDITGVLVQREITIMEMKADKTGTTPRGSPRKISSSSTEEKSSCSYTLDKDTLIKIPKVEPPYDEPTITMTMIDYTKPKGETQQTKTSKVLITSDAKIGDVKFKLPKREDIEIPGMESIEESVVKNIDMKVIKDPHQAPDVHQPGVQIAVQSDIEKSERHKTKKYGDKKEQEKKSKKPKISMPSFGITKPDIRFPDFGIEVPKKDAPSKKDTGEIMETQLEVDVPHTDIKHKDASPDSKGHRKETTMEWKTTDGIRITVDNKTELLNLTEFDDLTVKAPKAAEESSVVDVQDTKFKLLAMSPSAGIKYPEEEKGVHSVHVDGKAHDSKTEAQGRKFKLPKFEISLPEVKAPKLSPSKKEDDVLRGDRKTEVPAGQGEMAYGQSEKEADILEQDSKTLEIKMQRPTFSFPKFGFSRSESKEKETDVSLPRVDVSIPKDRTDEAKIRVSKSKDKTPETKIDTSGVEVLKAEPPSFDAELKLLDEPTLESDIKPDLHKDKEMLSVDVKAQDIQIEGQSKGKTEVCPPKLPEGVLEAEIPEIDSKGLDVKTKGPSFTFPKFGISKSEAKAPEADASLPVVGVSLPEANVDLEGPKTDISLSMGDTEQKEETKFGSPTKFKLPSFTLPKFGVKAPKGTIEISTADVQGKDHEISLPEAELKLSAEPLSVDIKGPDVELEKKSLSVDINSQDIQIEQQGSKFKLPKFGISLPEVKGPKIDSSTTKTEIAITLPEGQVEVHPPDVKVTEGATQLKADMPEIDSKGLEVKTKGPSFSFPKFGFSKSEMKAPEVDPGLPTVDVPVPEGSIDLKETATVSTGDMKQKEKSKFGSPTKFKLPSITMPKFGAKAPKGPMESSAVDVQAKGPEISVPDAEVKSTELLSVEIKGTDVELDKSLSVDLKARNIQTEQQGSKFKLPKFGISLPEVKGPKTGSGTTKTEIDVSLPEGTMEVCPPDTKLPEGAFEVKAEIPETDSKGLDVKTKRSSFTFPKFGFSKSEMKATDVDASLPVVDVSLPEGDGNIEGPKTDITLSVGDTEQKDETKFGSPTKFKLPSFTLPKFGAKAPKLKADMPTVDVEVKGHDMSLPNTELSAEPLPADVKVGDINKQDIKKPQDMQTEEQGSSFKLPKFGISLPEVKGTKLAVESSVDVQAKGPEIGLPDTEVKLSTEPLSVEGAHVELDKSLSVDMKPQDIRTKEESSKFKLPKFGIGLPEVKGPKIDSRATKTEIDITLPEGKVEVHPPDVKVTEGATELKADMPEIDSKGLEVKTKGPSFSFPKFGFSKSQTKTSEPDVSFQNVGVSVQEGSIDLEGPNVDTAVSISDREQKEDSRFGSPTKFKLPSISIPKFSSKTSKAPADISAEDVQTKGPEINLSDTELKLPGGPDTKQNIPIVDVKVQDIQIEGQGRKFKLPKFGISLPEVKGTKADASASKTELNISLPEGTIEAHPPDTTLPEKVIKVKVDSKGLDVISGTKLQIKTPEADVSLPKADASVHEGTTQPVDTQSQETKDKDNAVVTGSPIKFKLPTFKMPTFGKTSETRADISVPEKDIALCASDKDVKLHDPQAEAEIEDPIQKPTETAGKHEEGEKGSPSRFKLPTIKMSKISISKTKSQDGDNDTSMGVNAPEVILEPKHKKDTQGQGKSSKFTIPTLDDILRGFDVEFNVPTLEETEEAKTEASPVNLKGSLKESDKVLDSEASLEKQTVLQTDQKPEDEEKQMTNEKSSWFKFPKFSSPTKTAKDVEKESFQPPQETEERLEAGNKEKEPELSSTRETEEDNISPTLSLRSSDAFGDISSAQTTEQVGLSLASPTKVKVKYSESTAAVEISDLHGDVVTSTARTELISMEPHQPEKVNIPWSSEKSSSSVDTQRQMSGEFHIIVSNVQMVPDTQRTTIVTSLDTQDIQSLPLEGVAIQSGSGLSVEGTRVLKEERTVVERRVVKEMFGDEEEKVFVTMRTQVFEGDSVEPISDETASSIQKLRDTVHTEKMRFFESAESNEQNTTSNETSLRHIDSSAEENEGK
ncbi:hypothetical protein NFI96_006146, partial [Prochilodus magdalenae]